MWRHLWQVEILMKILQTTVSYDVSALPATSLRDTQRFLLIFVLTRTTVAFKHTVIGLPSSSLSNTRSLPSWNPPIHWKNIARLLVYSPYTENSSLISTFVSSTITTITWNFKTICCSIFGLICMFDKNWPVQLLNVLRLLQNHYYTRPIDLKFRIHVLDWCWNRDVYTSTRCVTCVDG